MITTAGESSGKGVPPPSTAEFFFAWRIAIARSQLYATRLIRQECSLSRAFIGLQAMWSGGTTTTRPSSSLAKRFVPPSSVMLSVKSLL